MQATNYRLTRRQFMGLGAGAFTAFAVSCASPATTAVQPTTTNAAATTVPPTATTQPTQAKTQLITDQQPTTVPSFVELELAASVSQMQLFDGQPTTVWRYAGRVLQGDPNALQPLENSYLGPTIHLQRGQRVRIHFQNDLPEESVIHWHGLIVPEEADGHPRDVVGTGGRYTVEFDVINRAGTYWYHPHPDMRTGPQAYYGLAGLLIVTDEEEQSADLPSGAFDVPLVLQDRSFDANNQLVYSNNMMDGMTGFLGNQMVINGQVDHALDVATRPYRLRLLNGSNSRIYKLGWSDRSPLSVIATDGGLLAQPVERPYVMLAPGQRVEVWVDFGRYAVGSTPILQSLPFFNSPSTFNVVRVNVVQESAETQPLPTQLSTITALQPQDATSQRDVGLAMARMRWSIDGRTYELNGVAAEERVKANEVASWTFVNQGGGGGGMMGGGMMELPHPMHVHATQFQVVDRQIDAAARADWEQVHEGFVDEGWRDTVIVMPGERVTVLMPFTNYTGTFVYHCHNLEHEDMGMMRNFEVVA